jgi:hypothetical protein
VRTGTDHPAAWPAADKIEAVIAASQVRIATVKLPPMAASRVAGAAGFALEDQLAGAPADHHLGVSTQAPDGRVRVVVVARSLVAAIVAGDRRITRIIAEPELAAPTAGWRWCADESGSGFVRCSDGSAFPSMRRPPTARFHPSLRSPSRARSAMARRLRNCASMHPSPMLRSRACSAKPVSPSCAGLHGAGTRRRGELRVRGRSSSRHADDSRRSSAAKHRAGVRARARPRRGSTCDPHRRERRRVGSPAHRCVAQRA